MVGGTLSGPDLKCYWLLEGKVPPRKWFFSREKPCPTYSRRNPSDAARGYAPCRTVVEHSKRVRSI